jgi:uncharacterized protein (DUF2236 family)
MRSFARLSSVEPRAATGTVAWRINGERLMLLAWSRAILLQLAHPLIAEGVYEHSSFRVNPRMAVSRLRHTVGAMLALTFGDEATQAAAYAGIRAIHRRVNGRLSVDAGRFTAGTPYSAEDPDLVLWVHATLMESIPLVYERVVAPLTIAERDEYCVDAAPVAIALGARVDEVPRSWTAVRALIDATYRANSIAVTPHARELSRALLSPRFTAPLAPLTWVNRLFAVGDLPPLVREQYGFAWTEGNARALDTMGSLLRTVRHGTPALLALWPQARV